MLVMVVVLVTAYEGGEKKNKGIVLILSRFENKYRNAWAAVGSEWEWRGSGGGLTWRPSGPQPLATGRGAPSFGTATSIPGHTGRSVLLEKGRDGFES